MSLNNTYNTTIEIKENGKLTQAYKRERAIKRIRYAVAFIQVAVEAYSKKMATILAQQVNETLTPIKLDIVDWKYGTNLRAQYMAGKRTQAILATKRMYGLTS